MLQHLNFDESNETTDFFVFALGLFKCWRCHVKTLKKSFLLSCQKMKFQKCCLSFDKLFFLFSLHHSLLAMFYHCYKRRTSIQKHMKGIDNIEKCVQIKLQYARQRLMSRLYVNKQVQITLEKSI